MGLFAELKRRNLFRVGAAYLVSAWLVAQVADLALEAFGAPDWVLKMLLTLMAIGFPVALVFAWIFEKTPEGLKFEKDVDRGQPISPKTGGRLDRAIIGVLVLAVALLLADRFFLSAGAPETAEKPPAVAGEQAPVPATLDRSIAVLPFLNMSSDPEQEYFSDGLTDSLLHGLSQVRDLKVAARTSSFAFKGKNMDVRGIGQQLGVANVLEGSVQKAGNRLRIIAQLIDVSDGAHLWSETFDRTNEDIFAIQDEISAAVVKELKVTLGDDDARRLGQHGTGNATAYDLYLQGRHEFHNRTKLSLAKAADLFQQALAVDADYALAHTGLADTWMFLSSENYGDMDASEAAARARPHLERALELTPDSSEVAGSLGMYLDEFRQPGEFPGMSAIEVLERALKLDPANTLAGNWLALRYERIGRYRDSMRLVNENAARDPMHVTLLFNQAHWILVRLGVEAALPYVRKLVSLHPKDVRAMQAMYNLNLNQGRLDLALQDALAMSGTAPGSIPAMRFLADACRHLGDFDCTVYWLEKAEHTAPGNAGVKRGYAWLYWDQGEFARSSQLRQSLVDGLLENGSWETVTVKIEALELAASLNREGRFAEAAEVYQRIFSTQSETVFRVGYEDVPHLANMAWNYRNLEQREKELEVLEETQRRIDLARSQDISLWTLDGADALIQAHRGNYEAAETFMARAMERAGANPWMEFCLQQLGKLMPGSPAVRQAMDEWIARRDAQRQAAAADLALAITL